MEIQQELFLKLAINTLIANYFLIQRSNTVGQGMLVGSTGTISSLDNGNFRGVKHLGHMMSIEAGATLPSTMDAIGFYNDDAVGTPGNISIAAGYSGTGFTLSNFAGDVTGTSFDDDPNLKITWDTPAPTELSIIDDSETGEPSNQVRPGDTDTYAEFSFSLTQDDTATDITSVTVTMTGTGSISDFTSVRAYVDSNNNCDYNGTDTDLGELSFSGTPATATITFAPGQLQTSGPSDPTCFSIRGTVSSNPTDQKTLKFGVISTADVVNSQGYSFATTASPPLEGSAGQIRNTNYSLWEGDNDSDWDRGQNWDGPAPDSGKNCYVGTGVNTATVNVNPIQCFSAVLQPFGEIDWNNTSNVFEIYGDLTTDSTFTFSNANSATISMVGSINQSFYMPTTFPGNLIINNAGTTNKSVNVPADATISGDLICREGILQIPDGITLTILGDITVEAGCELMVKAGGTLALGNGSSLTVDTGGTLTIVGDAAKSATITSNNPSSSYNIQINGNIEANYYTIRYLNVSAMRIDNAATIDATNHLQNGSFYNPSTNLTFLYLETQIPGNSLAGMYFDSSSSGYTLSNIDTNTTTAGTLNITSYSGDAAGSDYSPVRAYGIVWTGETTSILVTVEENPESTTLVSGNTYKMGSIGFEQSAAGASFNDTDITSLKLELTGTSTSSDIDNVRLFKDTDCDGASGTLLSSGPFTGSPASITFSLGASAFIVEADAVTPPKNCMYIEFEIASDATNGNSAGFKIENATDIVDSEGYGISDTTPAPFTPTTGTISTPSTTVWLGSSDSNWNNVSNWSAGEPTSTKSCTINASANDPIITGSGEECQNLTINSGSLEIASGGTLDVYGNIANTSTFTVDGTLNISDGGSSLIHNISSTSTIESLNIAKTGSGNITIGTSLTINNLSFSGTDFILKIDNGRTLNLPSGLSLSAGNIYLMGGGTLNIGNGQTISINGGTFNTYGSNDVFPQAESTKAKISVIGGTGSWGFSASSGSVRLYGFHFDRINTNGVNLSGDVELTSLTGGQLTNLSSSYASMKGFQINTTGTIPGTASNIAWTWGDFNSFDPANANTPTESDAYTLISSTGCGPQSIGFTAWTGDFYESQDTFDTSTKVSASGCTISLGASSSSVQLLSFKATPYDGAVDITWETNLEKNHLGFNVYRSDINGDNYVQLNSKLLRNLNNYSNKRGKYRFTDNDVDNDQTYYYYIEDIEVIGNTSMHGPVIATPASGLGTPPTLADHNGDSNSDDTQDGGSNSGGTIANPSYKDLGNGIIIRHQTSSNLVLEITPQAPSFSPSTWNPTYEDVVIEGFSKTTTENMPALPTRTLLIEVDEFVSEANLIDSTLTTTVLNSHLISPAATYTLNGSDILEASYTPDATVYATNSDYSTSAFTLESDIIKNGNKRYLRVHITPLAHNPVAQTLTFSNSIKLEIGFDTNNWDIAPDGDLALESIANLLRIDFKKSGMYELNFSDLTNNSLEYSFEDKELADFRLYLNGSEVAIEIDSADNYFNAGDKIRFYLEYTQSLEDTKNTAFLSTTSLLASDGEAFRIQDQDADPYDIPDSENNSYLQSLNFEENLEYVDGDTLQDDGDHFVWMSMFNYAGYDELDFDVELAGLNQDLVEDVVIKVHLIGMKGFFGNENPHELELLIDDISTDSIVFMENGRQTLEFLVDPDFFNGTTNIKFKVPGTYAYDGDYDRIIIDKVEIDYFSYQPLNDYLAYESADSDLVHTVYGMSTANINVYDVTDKNEVLKLINTSIFTEDAGATYNASYYVDEVLNSSNLKKIITLEENAYLSVDSLSLNSGGDINLKATNHKGEYLIIGEKTLLNAAYELAEYRQDQGMSVKSVSLNDIYDQFGHGVKSKTAIKDFIQYAISSWKTKPKYILFLGDGTFDPLDHNVETLSQVERSTNEASTMNIPQMSGGVIDFHSDNYYGFNTATKLPNVSIGRIPTNNSVQIEKYIEKIKAFERGDSLPIDTKKYLFIADEEFGYFEKFREKSEELAEAATKFNSRNFSSEILDYNDYATVADYKVDLLNKLNSPPLFVNFMGHGAADLWGSESFDNDDIANLTNEQHSIMLSWNCENTYFYDPDKSIVSLAENFIFSEYGSIVFLGSTTQTTPTAQMNLARAFYNQMADETNSPHKNQRIGDILHRAKLTIGSNSYEQDIMNSFMIIGDPALKLPSDLFKPSKASTKKTSGGGCSAAAGDSEIRPSALDFFFEWFLFLLLIFGIRKFAPIRKS